MTFLTATQTVVLVIQACLVQDPKSCKEFRTDQVQNITMDSCNKLQGLYAVGMWVVDNLPDYQLTRYTCENPNSKA